MKLLFPEFAATEQRVSCHMDEENVRILDSQEPTSSSNVEKKDQTITITLIINIKLFYGIKAFSLNRSYLYF